MDGALGPACKNSPGWAVVVDDSDAHLEYGTYTGRAKAIAATPINPWGAVVLTITVLEEGPTR